MMMMMQRPGEHEECDDDDAFIPSLPKEIEEMDDTLTNAIYNQSLYENHHALYSMIGQDFHVKNKNMQLPKNAVRICIWPMNMPLIVRDVLFIRSFEREPETKELERQQMIMSSKDSPRLAVGLADMPHDIMDMIFTYVGDLPSLLCLASTCTKIRNHLDGKAINKFEFHLKMPSDAELAMIFLNSSKDVVSQKPELKMSVLSMDSDLIPASTVTLTSSYTYVRTLVGPHLEYIETIYKETYMDIRTQPMNHITRIHPLNGYQPILDGIINMPNICHEYINQGTTEERSTNDDDENDGICFIKCLKGPITQDQVHFLKGYLSFLHSRHVDLLEPYSLLKRPCTFSAHNVLSLDVHVDARHSRSLAGDVRANDISMQYAWANSTYGSNAMFTSTMMEILGPLRDFSISMCEMSCSLLNERMQGGINIQSIVPLLELVNMAHKAMGKVTFHRCEHIIEQVINNIRYAPESERPMWNCTRLVLQNTNIGSSTSPCFFPKLEDLVMQFNSILDCDLQIWKDRLSSDEATDYLNDPPVNEQYIFPTLKRLSLVVAVPPDLTPKRCWNKDICYPALKVVLHATRRYNVVMYPRVALQNCLPFPWMVPQLQNLIFCGMNSINVPFYSNLESMIITSPNNRTLQKVERGSIQLYWKALLNSRYYTTPKSFMEMTFVNMACFLQDVSMQSSLIIRDDTIYTNNMHREAIDKLAKLYQISNQFD